MAIRSLRLRVLVAVLLVLSVSFSLMALNEKNLAKAEQALGESTIPTETTIDVFAPESTAGSQNSGASFAAKFPYDQQIRRPVDIATWDRENSYMLRQLLLRTYHVPKPLGNHIPSPEDIDPGSRRILVVGDSFVWGFGLYDLDRVWQRNLAVKLTERYGTGSTQVISLARGGISLYTYLEYITAETISEHKPDLIIFGVLPNDWWPDGSEKLLCPKAEMKASPNGRCTLNSWYNSPSYVKCLLGEDNLVGKAVHTLIRPLFPRTAASLQRRLCSSDRFGAYMNQATSSASAGVTPSYKLDPVEWLPYLRSELQRVKAVAGNVPLLVYPSVSNIFGDIPVGFRQILESEGYRVMPNPNAAAFYSGNPTSPDLSLQVNPADRHPSSKLSEAYARDVFDYLELHYAGTVTSPKDLDKELLSNFTPSSIRLSKTDGEGYLAAYDPQISFPQKEKDPTVTTDILGNTTPAQRVPCAEIGRPYAQFILNPDVLAYGVDLQVSPERLPAGGLLFYPITYLDTGVMTLGTAIPLTNNSFDFHFDRRTTGFFVAAPFSGCPLDKEIDLPAFSLRLTTSD